MTLEDTIGRIYENFVMRDLTYGFAGILILASLKYIYDGKIIDGIEYITSDLIRLLFFLLVAYFTGLLVKEGLTYTNTYEQRGAINKNLPWAWRYKHLTWAWWFSTDHLTPKNFDGFYVYLAKIEKKFGYATIKRLERTAYFYHIGAAFGTSSFVCFLILLFAHLYRYFGVAPSINYSPEYILFFLAMPFLFIVSLWYNHKKLNEYNYHLSYLW